jgi:hypothetical protein
MRVALCLSGQARGIDKTWYKFVKNIIEPNNCDVFISFANDSSLDNFYKVKIDFTELELTKDPSLEYLYSIARGPMPYIRHIAEMGEECTNLAVLRQYYFIKRANDLKSDYEKRNGFVYDWVIRSRADLYINEPLDDLSKLDNSCIFIPASNNGGGLNDFFAFSSSKNMDIYCNRIEEVKKIEMPPFPFWNPHQELQYILNKNNIPVFIGNINIEREREWRGIDDENCHKYYGKYGEPIIEYRRKIREG